MKANIKLETSVLKQEIVITLKKIIQGHKSIINNQIKQSIDNLKAYLEKSDSEFNTNDFYNNHFDLFQLCLEKHDKKLDLLIFEFFEKIQRQYLINLDEKTKNTSLYQISSKERSIDNNNKFNYQSDCLISEFCRMFEYKDYKLTQRLIQFIHGFITLSGNEISPLTLNKIVCNYLITYFEAKNSYGNNKLINYIDVCLGGMIKFLVDDLELHTRLVKNKSSIGKTTTLGFLKNNATFCSLMTERIIEDAVLIASSKDYKPIRLLNIDSIVEYEKGKYFNSIKQPCGRFGWCFICNGTADYYCIAQRLPICSVDCKLTLAELTSPSDQYKEQKLSLIQVMYKYFVKLSSKRNENINLDFKAYVLSKILMLYRNSGVIFTCDNRTINRTSDFMLNELIHNFCFSEGKVFDVCVQIFNEIIKKYRKTFKKEIKIMIKYVLLNLLKAKELKSDTKSEILKCLSTIIFDVKSFTYFYLNFDLSLYEDFSIQEIIGYLVKNAQLNGAGNTLSSNLASDCIQIMCKLIHKALGCLNHNKDKAFIEVYLSEVNGTIKSDILKNYVSQSLVDCIKNKRKNIDILSSIIAKFNVKHTSIVKNFEELSFYMPDASDPAEKLAYLFYHNSQISKTKLGDFFGEPDEIYQNTLQLYFEYEDYRGLRVDEAMSSFMNLFDLPGEGQKIDRILQKFSVKFSNDNPNVISEKCAYGLSFLVMMLQSEWHNPQVIEKMSYEQFMKLGMNIEEYEKYLSETLMKGIYETLTKKTLGSPDYYRGSNGLSPLSLIQIQGVRHFNKKSKFKDTDININTKIEYDYVFLEYFRKDLADALIVSLSMSYESAKNPIDCITLGKGITDLFDIFIVFGNKSSLEQLLMAVARLTALDKVGRPLEHKNVTILSLLTDFVKHNGDYLTSNCLKIWFTIFFNMRYYITEPTPYETVLKKNNYLLLKEQHIDEKLENFIFYFFDNSKNQLKIYQTVSLLFESVNGLLADKDLEIVLRFVLTKLFDYFKFAFDKKKDISTLQSFYNVIVSNALNTISNLNTLDDYTKSTSENADDNLVIFIISELGEIVKLFARASNEETNVFKPYEMLLSNLNSEIIRW